MTAARRNVRLIRRRGVDHTERFVDIAAAIRRLPARTLILDGEVCVFDQTLVSHMHLLTDPPADANVTPPLFMTFDCLYGRGKHVRRWPLKDRRKVMEDEIEGSPVLPARRLPDNGLEAWCLVQRNVCIYLPADGIGRINRVRSERGSAVRATTAR